MRKLHSAVPRWQLLNFQMIQFDNTCCISFNSYINLELTLLTQFMFFSFKCFMHVLLMRKQTMKLHKQSLINVDFMENQTADGTPQSNFGMILLIYLVSISRGRNNYSQTCMVRDQAIQHNSHPLAVLTTSVFTVIVVLKSVLAKAFPCNPYTSLVIA